MCFYYPVAPQLSFDLGLKGQGELKLQGWARAESGQVLSNDRIACFEEKETKGLHKNRVEKPQRLKGDFLRFCGKTWGQGETRCWATCGQKPRERNSMTHKEASLNFMMRHVIFF